MKAHDKDDLQRKQKKDRLIVEKLEDFPARSIPDPTTGYVIPIEHEYPMDRHDYHARAISILLDDGKVHELKQYLKKHACSFREYSLLKTAVRSNCIEVVEWLLEVDGDMSTQELKAAYKAAIKEEYKDIAALIGATIPEEMVSGISRSPYLQASVFSPLSENDTGHSQKPPVSPKK